MSSVFKETNAIDVEAFQFPDIEWSFDQDDSEADEEAPDFSLTLNTNPDSTRPDTDDADMSTALNRSFGLKRIRRIDTENPARMVRSGALYYNLYMLGAG